LSVVLATPDVTSDAIVEMAVDSKDSMAGVPDGAAVFSAVAVAEITATTDPSTSVMTAVGNGATVDRSVLAPGAAGGGVAAGFRSCRC
jgi:hypothetical protein